MHGLTTIQTISVSILPLIFAITVHEVAHGWVASKLGDPTARMLGRLTLNPIKHIDPIGTLLVPGILLLLGGFIFGWAKPVPVDWRNLRNPRRDMALVAAAGPGANLAMAIGWTLIAKVGLLLAPVSPWVSLPLILMGKVGIYLNLILMVLNLLPLPPLDGGRVLVGLLPPQAAASVARIEPYGFYILLALLFFGVLGRIIGPPIFVLERLLYSLAGI
ncbi:MAG TPA: site-2 protease family protein [Thiotrichales bacterium]|nr:site-2 protease family protein [Thiotrichales bacterium]